MRKHFLILLTLSVCFFYSCNNNDEKDASARNDLSKVFADSSKYTTVRWLDTTKDFGIIQMGQKVKVTFVCKNTGSKPLYLSDVRPSCGCTLADYTKEPIAPNKSGKVTAEFDSNKSHPGKVRKTIYVHTNTKNSLPPYLIFTGEIQHVDSANTASKNL